MNKSLLPLFSSLMLQVPLSSNHWKETKFLFQALPEYQFKENKVLIKNKGSIGGYLYLFEKPIKLNSELVLKVNWTIDNYPKVEIKLPFNKENDDYPFRIGLILTGGERKADIPKFVLSLLPSEAKKISEIIYYGPVEQKGETFCGISPHNKHSIYCAVPSLETKEFIFSPLKDLSLVQKKEFNKNLKILAIWLLSDTDDSKSKSRAEIQSISFQNNTRKP